MKRHAKNPKPESLLNLGDLVAVKATVRVERCRQLDKDLNETGPLKRFIERTEFDHPRSMFVIGGTHRRLGTVHVSKTYGGFDGPVEQGPGYLTNIQTVFVYQMREGFTRKIVEVLPSDVLPENQDA
jgi:hypothetical protein